ncbi:MAG TPA: 2-hydroxyhepta-2,4-diene-1,7-dioate isomerase [Rhodospirillaceae bacterium]|jgi:2-keto-4-pentenoate hydratase/2-oxohepta-3-ene-1,7-dioic acid hydratase in catechol pathway|nr:2-hydroxyhepta-2,4-diene-1,7-dioate isomerase [Rhodospirillaceae bacterium]MAX62653.1 2-hydroxyhepta-2,4-diene-1,7-dioate isomerase [Rhodospirillaceae bacterium]MBB57053.1 2-hydroxyhepta-2,4-diene-1,7-dioate isomerase [Rhodospirillaceae bacterium]HAE02860.1 2-hydroxyhepta-2,4-diene-1,7-dioate isomerase [Rhodospirillaceae bacterium]HAJ21642.1 2-hydroxyhepta-2,4-diene-1,7-dioate isomerase [Rhodospirillaceae bacterium]|tara:strand:+ start:63705 stop:64556 length:852 start_codon:yes stop_codon:yes gene_type:complete
MRLIRFGEPGHEKPGVLDANGTIRDLSGIVRDITPETLADGLLDKVSGVKIDDMPAVQGAVRIGPCIKRPGKIVCIGLNYKDHADEAGMERPSEPIVFMKATSSICGPNDNLILPLDYEKVDWEIELGVVIGQHASYLDDASVESVIAGYCIVNDVSERSFQLARNGQWTKGKSADTFCPIGPWLVTKDEIQDPDNLPLKLTVDGTVYQDSNTAQMIFDVKTLVSYVSKFMSLEPGDIIATGTPAGVGMGQKPPVYLQPGNELVLEIDGLGVQRQTIVEMARA